MPSLLLSRDTSVLVIIDVQERLLPAIHDGPAVLARILFLASTARQLGIPLLVTEQYPKGLGRTVAGLGVVLGEWSPVEKSDFSCAAVPEFSSRLAALGRTEVVLAGLETHVCIAQTALELAAAGTRTAVVADATGSRRPLDRDTALARMSAAGMTVTTAEAVAFEWLRRAGTDEFRAVSARLKALAPA